MRNIIISGVIILIFTGCIKEKFFPNTIINGVVKDSSSLQNLGDVHVDLFRWKDNGLWNSNYKRIDIKSTETDNSGNWEMKFRQAKERLYFINFSKAGYYEKEYQFGENEPLEKNIYLVPKGNIEITFTDNTSSTYNKIFFHIVNPYSINTYSTTCSQYLPETRVFDAIGNAYNKVEWTLYINPECWGGDDSGSISMIDSIWVGQNETVIYSIQL